MRIQSCSLSTLRRKLKTGNLNSGFTIMELLLFASIFAITSIAFITVLVSITRVQVRQSGSAEVTSQSQFVLQTIGRYVAQSSAIEIPADVETTTLKLRMASSTSDPTYVYLSGSSLYLKLTDSGTPTLLTSDKVSISDVRFVRRTNPGGKDSASVQFTVSLNTENVQQKFSQAISLGVARVNAATFDSNLVPSVDNSYKIGASSQIWQSVNDVIYFSSSNVGIGALSPGAKLEVNGGVRLNTATAKPTCDASQRGTLWYTQNGGGSADDVDICVRNASSSYVWYSIY